MASSTNLGNETLDVQATLTATFSPSQAPTQICWSRDEQTTPEMPSFTIPEWMDNEHARMNFNIFVRLCIKLVRHEFC